jgi:hypothetical protein
MDPKKPVIDENLRHAIQAWHESSILLWEAAMVLAKQEEILKGMAHSMDHAEKVVSFKEEKEKMTKAFDLLSCSEKRSKQSKKLL